MLFTVVESIFDTCITFAILFLFKKISGTLFYVCIAIRWCVTAEITFIRESIQDDEQANTSFRTTPEITADVDSYDQRELFVILFNQVSNFLFVGSGWRIDSVPRLSISLCHFRPTIVAGFCIQILKFLHSKGVKHKKIMMIIASYGPFSGIYTE